ncbi:hypothetical protein A2483_00840 [Candidatus Peregrinibacteria bacterium RIFOXYC2_FULL_33_13]|nr:MAG: Aminotransferase class I and II [Candidatus Peregrinibacteria bacterium GW2011_GWA2_33_10]KKP39167.1 MAG: aspartate aminotransferase, aspartate aminotransferase [Candidatus Peregrinibacteria bacterium GW2011_GWC2_33_13]OGJ55816.1 MAG: hypothetical protein A2483_00840 [Candidatus Peregrinibacteria bacterium RIFOXYC2_FULL_33_13]
MLTQNEYGFSVENDNPFLIFPYLQKISKEAVGEANVIDLSRGDPGYNFTPSIKGRQFFSYLIFLDSYFNAHDDRFIYLKRDQINEIFNQIEKITKENYSSNKTKENIENLNFFIDKIIEITNKQDLNYDKYDVLYNIFKYCTVSGGNYTDPFGEPFTRAVVADWHQQILSTKIDYKDIIFTNGASQAIGSIFKLLGKIGINYLREHDKVMVISPVYSPYNKTCENLGLKTISISVDPITGEINPRSIEMMKTYQGEVRAIVLVDPSNPTGFPLSEDILKKISNFAKEKNSIVITDEVYSAFFPKKKTILDYCPERTIRINSRSKIEKSTGLRFGDITVAKEGQKYITENILKDYLWKNIDIMRALIMAKGPGGSQGEFQHTTFVPAPMQILGISHIILGKEEREIYRDSVANNRDGFYKILDLPHKGNNYYVLFDLNKIQGCKKKHIPIEQKLIDLAKKGVVYIPSLNFFSEQDKAEEDYRHTVRASVVNAPLIKIKEAAQITKAYLCS